jgi:tetratricopeptide (TPR) repeat protein
MFASATGLLPLGYQELHSWRQLAGIESQQEETPIRALQSCDALASHPSDPGRYSAGVPDELLAPGAAIEACESAVRLNPDQARAWFQLGRAYWGAQRDQEALNAFVEAAKQNYGPAKKYVGDAYLTGRGLPSGEQRDSDAAMRWYKEACGKPCNPSPNDVGHNNAGFPDAEKALTDLEEYLAKTRFDPSTFQNPTFISAAYYNDQHDIPLEEWYIYLYGFTDEISGDKILYVDSNCKPLSNVATKILTGIDGAIGLARIAIRTMSPNENVASRLVKLVTSAVVYEDQGHRDAVNLVNRYGCKSKVAQEIMGNIVVKLKILESTPAR